jgi:hypothetical protein
LEGEISLGVNHDDFIYVPSCGGPICAANNIAIFISNARLNNAEGLYAVGYLPLTPDIDLFARAGYAYSDYSAAHFLSSGFSQQSFNYGAGGQFFFDGVDGIRFDYTRQDVMDEDSVGRQAVGRDANVWSVSFVRRF